MNKIEFAIPQGFPLSEDTLEFMQNMMLQSQHSSLLGGSNYILSGCTVSGGVAAGGWVVINGEVLPFQGGAVGANVIVVQNTTQRQFFGGENHDYYKDRYATFGDGTGAVAWASLTRNNPANGVLARLDKIEKMLKPLLGYTVSGTTYYGSWLFWGRPAGEIPAGWEPVPDEDWKGKVPVVYKSGDEDFGTVGQTGGEKKHTLNIDEMPAHHHEEEVFTAINNGGRKPVGFADTENDKDGDGYNTGDTGGGQPHNNLQPYKVVMFIRFVG